MLINFSKVKQTLQFVVTTADYDTPPYFPGFASTEYKKVLAETEWNEKDIVLQIEMHGEAVTVRYGTSENNLHVLCTADGAFINPEKVGCMSGTIIGMYATGNGADIENQAEFNWFEMK